MSLPPIDDAFLQDVLKKLLNIPSPTGFTEQVNNFIEGTLKSYPFLVLTRTHKGALVAEWKGHSSTAPRALTAHVDTLGAMVKEIKSNGRLKLTKIGGFAWNTVEGEGCTVYTNKDEQLRGSLLLVNASSHVHGSKVNELKRDDDNMEVRLDARTETEEDTRRNYQWFYPFTVPG